MKIGLEVRVAAWDRGQLQGWRVGTFQDSTDLKRRQDGRDSFQKLCLPLGGSVGICRVLFRASVEHVL